MYSTRIRKMSLKASNEFLQEAHSKIIKIAIVAFAVKKMCNIERIYGRNISNRKRYI